jgi:3-deoxy-manno-octulosonate cytidylyltransferase (CMP-KDO synthetase)
MLEQLRVLENGWRIRVVRVPYDSTGVDTPSDVKVAEALIRRMK